jgi:hypothetical protein
MLLVLPTLWEILKKIVRIKAGYEVITIQVALTLVNVSILMLPILPSRWR